MINIKGSKFPEDLFRTIDQVHQESCVIYNTLPNEAAELLNKDRKVSTPESVTKKTNNKPKV